jgi:formylglycine-generating enzyme required for sulfatase activity
LATWVKIPAGTFQLGSPATEPCRNSGGNPEDQHSVTLTRDFEIQSTEVTQEQFKGLMEYNPSPWLCGANCPMQAVKWHEAAAYCNALSGQKGLAACYSCAGGRESLTCTDAPAYSGDKIYSCPGYRLPTEAEWEYAYRAGTTTAYWDGANDPAVCDYCTSDENADPIGWYCGNAATPSEGPHPVAQKRPSPWGLYDMAGNVAEWCHDWYQSSLGYSAATDPWGPPSGSFRVLRGGSSGEGAGHMRAAQRGGYDPPSRNGLVGFRCARTLP